MKKMIAIIIFLLPIAIHAQVGRFIDSLLDNKIILLPTYRQSVIGNESLLLQMNYAKPGIIDTTGIGKLMNADILSVDLVFTDYPATSSLKELNTKRFQNLISLAPFIVQQKSISWQVIRQTDGKDKASSEKLLHGFVINYRPEPTKAFTRTEISLIKKIVDDLPKPVVVEQQARPKKKIRYWDVIYGRSQLEKPRYFYGRPVKDITNSKVTVTDAGDSMMTMTIAEAMQKNILNDDEKRRFGKPGLIYILFGPEPQMRRTVKRDEPGYAKNVTPLPLPDSSVIITLLNNHFKKVLIVADVTSSMSPYIGQLLHWLSATAKNKNVQFITCFNDGDDMRNENKRLGSTGGIYGEPFTNILQAGNLIENTMNNGSGGDTPENVCEALIKSIEMCKDCDDVVLMADNWAPARDITLVKQIKKPVKIVVCGGTVGVQPDYVTIALETGGGLYFPDGSVIDFTALKQGKEITIRGLNYKLDEAGKVMINRK